MRTFKSDAFCPVADGSHSGLPDVVRYYTTIQNNEKNPIVLNCFVLYKLLFVLYRTAVKSWYQLVQNTKSEVPSGCPEGKAKSVQNYPRSGPQWSKLLTCPRAPRVQEEEEEEVFITSGNWRGKHNSLSREGLIARYFDQE